jgi:uncharacterized protein
MTPNAVILPRAPVAADLPGLLALNTANETELSRLDSAGLRRLIASAFYCGVTGPVGTPTGFMIALDHTATYASPNYLWFRQRLDRFVYIDRIVIAASARGQGYAQQLYAAAFIAARNAHHTAVCCEVNEVPPNPASDRLHARLGFTSVGRAVLPVQTGQLPKTVRYLQAAALTE